MSRNGAPLLEVQGLVKRFGGFTALDGLSLAVHAGEVLGLAGPNGSGKTTAINAVSGLFRPNAGSVHLAGRPIERMSAYQRVRLGVNRTFQVPRSLSDLSALENVELAVHFGRRAQHEPGYYLERAGLGEYSGRKAAVLNTSEQKRLDLARALATEPRLLLIDELGAGLTPEELARMAELISALATEGRAIVVVEHLMDFLQKVTDRVCILDAGRPIFEGAIEEAAEDRTVVEVFLGR